MRVLLAGLLLGLPAGCAPGRSDPPPPVEVRVLKVSTDGHGSLVRCETVPGSSRRVFHVGPGLPVPAAGEIWEYHAGRDGTGSFLRRK